MTVQKKQQEETVKELIISTADSWASKSLETESVELPSGVIIKMKKQLTILDEALTGRLSLPMLSVTYEIASKLSEVGKQGIGSVTDDEMKRFGDVLKRVAQLAVLEPKVVDGTVQPGEMDVNLIPGSDLLFIFTYLNTRGGTAAPPMPFPAK